MRRYGSDPGIVGKPITLDGANYTVIGVAPPGFQYPDKTELWVPPLRLVPELYAQVDPTQNRGMGYLAAVALLKPGVTVAQAASEMETITTRLRKQYPETNNRRFNRVVSLHDHLIGDNSTMLLLLFGAVMFVLLIACANVANLLLASASSATQRDCDSRRVGSIAEKNRAATADRERDAGTCRRRFEDCCSRFGESH